MGYIHPESAQAANRQLATDGREGTFGEHCMGAALQTIRLMMRRHPR